MKRPTAILAMTLAAALPAAGQSIDPIAVVKELRKTPLQSLANQMQVGAFITITDPTTAPRYKFIFLPTNPRETLMEPSIRDAFIQRAGEFLCQVENMQVSDAHVDRLAKDIILRDAREWNIAPVCPAIS